MTAQRTAILFFIPGNPGIETYYTAFFASLKRLVPGLDIICFPHLGFDARDITTRPSSRAIDLDAQIAHKVDILDSILLGRTPEEKARRVPIYLAGHSVGAYMAIQVLSLRPESVERAYLLFPTLSHIAASPQGRVATTLLLRVPGLVTAATCVTWVVANLLPQSWRRRGVAWWTGFPEDAVAVTEERVLTTRAVHAALTLARSEMVEIKDPDAQFWKKYASRCTAYWARHDGWVSERHRTELLAMAEGMESYHCNTASHAFCIRHGDLVAEKVGAWLRRDLNMLQTRETDPNHR